MKHCQNAWWKERWKLWIKTWVWWQLQMSPQPLNKTPAVGSWPLSFPAWGFSREASGLQADTKSHTYFPVALPLETQTLYCPIVSLRSQQSDPAKDWQQFGWSSGQWGRCRHQRWPQRGQPSGEVPPSGTTEGTEVNWRLGVLLLLIFSTFQALIVVIFFNLKFPKERH